MTSFPDTSMRNRDALLIMWTDEGWYPIRSSGTKSLADEAADHGCLNKHITRIEDSSGKVLWRRQ